MLALEPMESLPELKQSQTYHKILSPSRISVHLFCSLYYVDKVGFAWNFQGLILLSPRNKEQFFIGNLFKSIWRFQMTALTFYDIDRAIYIL